MFQFGRKVFGRKGLGLAPGDSDGSSPQASQPEPWRPSRDQGLDLTIDEVRARCEALARSGKYSGRYYLAEVLNHLAPSERAALFASFAADVEVLNVYDRSDTRESWIRDCYRKCLDADMQPHCEHLPALLTLLLGDDSLARYYYVKPFNTMLRLIGQAIKDGGFLTSADLERLGALANQLRAASEKERSKANKKAILRKAEAIEKLAGLEVSATSLLLERCDGAENPYAMGARPANYDFWSGLIAETIAGLHAIKDAFQAKAKPNWMSDAAAFAEAWPQVGPIAPRFGAWKEPDPKLRDFSVLRGFTKRRHMGQPGFADPERVRDLPRLRELYAPTMDWCWNTPQIPALEVLADLESPAWTALIEHLITGKVAPRPTAAWLKAGLKLADAIGRPVVAERLHTWLALFHTPALTAESLADRTNVEEMDRTVAFLNEALPEWPAALANDDLRLAGRALAMVAACQAADGLPTPFGPGLVECSDHIWERKSATVGVLRIRCTTPRIANGSTRYDTPGTWLQVSIENEALLRGAMWLAAELSSHGEAIALLEAMALAGAGRYWTGDQGHRSRVVANAAIATLTDRAGTDVDAAILRLSRAIPDRTINMPLFKALNSEA